MKVVYEIQVPPLRQVGEVERMAEIVKRKISREIAMQGIPAEPVVLLRFNPRVPPVIHDRLFFSIAAELNRQGIGVTDSDAALPGGKTIRIRL